MGFKKTTEGRVFFQRSNHSVDVDMADSEERTDMFAIKDVEAYEDSLEHVQRSPLTGREINISRPFEIKDPVLEKQTKVEETIRTSILEDEPEQDEHEEALEVEAREAADDGNTAPEFQPQPIQIREQIQTQDRVVTRISTPVQDQDNGMQTEILGLLKSLNDRLKTTKAERNQLQEQMETYRSLIEGLEDKSERTEKAYKDLKVQLSGREKEAEDRAVKAEKIALETRQELERTKRLLEGMEEKSKETEKTLSELDSAHQEQERALRKAIETTNKEIASTKETISLTAQEAADKNAALYEGLEKKLQETSDRQTSLDAQVDEALAQHAALAQKIEKVAEDRARFMRKIELIEETVLQTRDALASFKHEADEMGYGQPLLSQGDETRNLAQALLEQSQATYDENEKRTGSFGKNVILSPFWPLFLAFVLGAIVIVWLMSEGPWDFMRPSKDKYASSTVVTSAIPEPARDGMLSDLPEFGFSTSSQTSDVDTVIEGVTAKDAEASDTADVVFEDVATEEELSVDTTNADEVIEESAAEITEPVEASSQTDLPDVIKKVEAQALKGSPEAQHDLGAIYVAGHAGVPQDYVKAAYWFEKAADQNVANAAYNLGVLHHQGLGVPADMKEALVWYEKAAKLGHPEAQYNLGIAYIEGVGVNYDAEKAAGYFKEAAQKGVMEAAYNLGLIYENGLLGQTRPDDALLWYKVAADKGSAEAKTAIDQLVKRLDIDSDEVQDLMEEDTSQIESDAADSAPIALEKSTVRPVAPLSPMENQQVLTRQIQEILMSNGLYPGPADGVFGPLTGDAIRTYQAQHQMPVDGAISTTLLHHMLSNQG